MPDPMTLDEKLDALLSVAKLWLLENNLPERSKDFRGNLIWTCPACGGGSPDYQEAGIVHTPRCAETLMKDIPWR